MTTRRDRAEARVIPICYPDGMTAGFLVRGWKDGQVPFGPFISYDLAIRVALENTWSLAEGSRRRHGR